MSTTKLVGIGEAVVERTRRREAHFNRDRKRLYLNRPEHAGRVDAVLLAPPGAGKTTLAASMVVGGVRSDEFPKAFVPLAGMSELIQEVHRHLMSREGSDEIEPRASAPPFRWQMHSGGGSGRSSVQELSIFELEKPLSNADPKQTVSEADFVKHPSTPGPDHYLSCEDPWFRSICFAPVWILLLDPAGKNRRWFLDQLPRWSRDLALVDGGDALPGGWPSEAGTQPLPVPRRVRRIRRVVVAFTHMDEVADRWLPPLLARPLRPVVGSLRSRQDLAGIDRFMERIDSEAWLRHLDSTFLQRIQTFLGGPEVELFVGCTSAVGWRRPSVEDPEWRPFGMDALLGLVLGGEARPPFARVSWERARSPFVSLHSATPPLASREPLS